MQMRIADLIRDADLAPTVHQLAHTLLADGPESEAVQHIVARWIGDSARFGNV